MSIYSAETPWFESWFDSPYYHLLYKNRDEQEASAFLDQLVQRYHFKKNSKVIDIACGKGRHSRYLAGLGLDVTGIDLSAESIAMAKEHETKNLHFVRFDMRRCYQVEHFDAAFSLFTSLGYFDELNDNTEAIHSAAKSLKNGGLYIVDFFNPFKVVQELVANETKLLEGIEFSILRHVENNRVIKNIHIKDGEKKFHFTEKVSLLDLIFFKETFISVGLSLLNTFGDYTLNTPFHEQHSSRMILVAKKKQSII